MSFGLTTVTLRLRQCTRYTAVDGMNAIRYLELEGPIQATEFKSVGDLECGDDLRLWVYEAGPEDEVIGSLTSLGSNLDLRLP